MIKQNDTEQKHVSHCFSIQTHPPKTNRVQHYEINTQTSSSFPQDNA